MIAASLLVAAVVAAYASLAVLSLSASTSSFPLGFAGTIANKVGSVIWQSPDVGDLGGYVGHTAAPPPTGGGAASISAISLGQLGGPVTTRLVTVGNSSGKPLLMHVAVIGDQKLGMSASFATGGSTMLVPAHTTEQVSLVTDPLQAGVIQAWFQISVPGSGAAPKRVPIYGTQSPEPPGPVTATAAAGGAVDLSWGASPSTGVSGYVVESSTGGSPFTPVGNSITGTSVVEQTGTNATTFSYKVVAVAAGVALPSAPALAAPVTTDSVGPSQPQGFPGLPTYINQANVGSFNVNVSLLQSSSTSDTITVTLTSPSTGATLTQTATGGTSPVSVQFAQAGSLPEGTVNVTATPTDSLGNPGPSLSTSIQKLTSGPGVPKSVQPSTELITSANLSEFSVAVATDAADAAAGDTITVTLASTSGPQSVTTAPLSAPADGSSVIPVDLSTGIGDGTYTVTATVTDPAGNTATTASSDNVTIDTTAPEKPATFYIAAGPDNPAGVINAQSQTAVTIAGHFANPLEDGETITISIDQGAPLPVDVVPGTQDISLGPLDLSALPDGPVDLKMTLTDANGNTTHAWRDNGFKETSGPTGPTSVGVPAGADNPAGYVNAATQSAATIVATFDVPTDPADQIALSVGGDSNFPVQSGGSAQATWSGLDLSQLPDGTLPIVVTVTDAAGNSSNFSGSLIKATQPPPAPVAAHVLGPPLDTIAPGNGSCVNVGVAFNQAPDPSDTVTVTLSDGATSVQGSGQAGSGQVTIGCIDASSLAPGSITVSVTVTDVAGNSTTMTGTTATKAGCHHSSG
jgi:Bacterial Ig-like domain